MKIDLSEKIDTHFKRLEDLAEEANADEEQSFSARSSAMTAMSGMLKELVKTQETVHSISSIQELQSAIVEALEEHDQEFKNNVIEILERRLATLK